MRLIDADELRDEVLHDTTHPNEIVNYYLYAIDYAPTIDAVPVVRCGECKYAVWEKNEIKYCETWGARCDCPYEISLAATDYCSYGEKMEDKP